MRPLDEMLQPGQKVKVSYNPGNIHNQVRHIRGIIDDDYVVYRVWSKKRRDWSYHIKHRYDFELKYEDGRLS